MPANTKTLTARQTRRLIEKLQLKVGTMIKITVEQALNSKQALKYLNEAHVFEQGQAIAFALASKEVTKVETAFNDEMQKLGKKFATPDGEDKPRKKSVMTQQGEGEIFDVLDENLEAFHDARKANLAQEVEVNVAYVLQSKLAKEKLPGHIYISLDWFIVAEIPKPADAAAPSEGE